MDVRSKLAISILALLLIPLVVVGVMGFIGIIALAPLITYFACTAVFIYIYHLLIASGLFFKIGSRIGRRIVVSPVFSYVLRSALLWMFFLPISRILGDLVKWYVSGEYVELSRGDYYLYVMTLMLVGIGAGAFLSLAYLLVVKKS